MTTFTVIKTIVTLGPDVIGLIGDVLGSIVKHGGAKDRKKAERILYTKAWRIKNGIPDSVPFDTEK
jgi:hypothetical protein